MTNITRKEIRKVFQRNGKKMYYLNLEFDNHKDPIRTSIIKDYNYKILLFKSDDIGGFLAECNNGNRIFYGNKQEITFSEIKKIKNEWENDTRFYLFDSIYKTFRRVEIKKLSSIKELNKFFDYQTICGTEKMIKFDIYN